MAEEPYPSSAVIQPIPEPTAPEKLPISVPQPTPPEKLPASGEAHSVPETGKESDKMMAALSYLPIGPLNLIFSVINLMGEKKYNKFHGGQAIGWLILEMVFWFIAFTGFSFSFLLGPLALLLLIPLGLVVFLGFIAYPAYVGYKAFQGETKLMPIVGNLVLDKLNLRFDEVKA